MAGAPRAVCATAAGIPPVKHAMAQRAKAVRPPLRRFRIRLVVRPMFALLAILAGAAAPILGDTFPLQLHRSAAIRIPLETPQKNCGPLILQALEQHPGANGMGNGGQPLAQALGAGRVAAFDINDHVADLGGGLKVLAGDVDRTVGEDSVDGRSMPGRLRWMCNSRCRPGWAGSEA